MPFVETTPDEWRKRLSRVVVSGSPNSRKTTNLATWPGRIAAVSYPGEKGFAAMARESTAGIPIRSWNWSLDEIADVKWGEVVKELRSLTADIVNGKKGEFDTFAGDGLHKLYAVFLAEATFGASAKGEPFEAKLYGNAHARFFDYVDLVFRSKIQHAVFTVWDGAEKDDAEDKSLTAPKHIFPDLPGQAAKKIMGESSMVLHATKNNKGDFVWLTQPTNKVWGAGLKLPAAVAAKIPQEVPQDYTKFFNLVVEAAK
jgi:hypothetical protein